MLAYTQRRGSRKEWSHAVSARPCAKGSSTSLPRPRHLTSAKRLVIGPGSAIFKTFMPWAFFFPAGFLCFFCFSPCFSSGYRTFTHIFFLPTSFFSSHSFVIILCCFTSLHCFLFRGSLYFASSTGRAEPLLPTGLRPKQPMGPRQAEPTNQIVVKKKARHLPPCLVCSGRCEFDNTIHPVLVRALAFQ